MLCRCPLSELTILPHSGQVEPAGKIGPLGRRCWNIPSRTLDNSTKPGNGIPTFHRERNVSIISGNQTRFPSPTAIRCNLRLEFRNHSATCPINPQQLYEPNISSKPI